ncbi:hypothetical protein [Telmatospirillum sp.]|uniref:hypothetical protein n=1 Tax=Telmatospirillum sp. TaxID=2079197 RepID=UPI00283FCF2B|nr:hypothetical protein [Telmatospirillum sp.]MDR3437419.1 hypothetical protein [Telmatospirillum sp.]
MKLLFSVWLLAAALLPCYALAAEPVRLPDWLVGKWRVVEIYEDDDAAYQSEIGGSPDFEPKLWYAGRTLDVTADSIRMDLPLRHPVPHVEPHTEDELCTDFTAINEEQGTRRQFLKEWLGVDILREGHFPRRPEPVVALKIACGNKAHSRNVGGWLIFHPNADTIETTFGGHGYLVLRRVKPRS